MQKRRDRGDVIQVYKIFHEIDKLPLNDILTLDQGGLRNNGLKLKQEAFKTNLYKHHFTNRVVLAWNSLPSEVVSAGSLSSFKRKLDKHWISTI